MNSFNNMLFNQFVGRVSECLTDIPLDSSDNEVQNHLLNNVIGNDVPTLSEVKAAITVYLELLNSPPHPPQVVSMRQARLALLQANLLSSVEEAVAAGNETDKISWEYATEVKRTDALVISLSASLNLSEQQLDDLFRLAVTL
jgi:hypothetical protein